MKPFYSGKDLRYLPKGAQQECQHCGYRPKIGKDEFDGECPHCLCDNEGIYEADLRVCVELPAEDFNKIFERNAQWRIKM